jgi:hypothetical protein
VSEDSSQHLLILRALPLPPCPSVICFNCIYAYSVALSVVSNALTSPFVCFSARFAPSLANVNLMQMLGPNTAKEVDKQVSAGVVTVFEWCFWRFLATVHNRWTWLTIALCRCHGSDRFPYCIETRAHSCMLFGPSPSLHWMWRC